MMHSITLLAAASAAVLLAYAMFGYQIVYEIAYGGFTLMAAIVSLTFLWLWAHRATPLAMGMAFSWAGAASVMGWWWVFNVLNQPPAMRENGLLFLFLAIYFVGALLHFAVSERSLGYRRYTYILPVLLCLALSSLVAGLV